jgi:hypothetical protein
MATKQNGNGASDKYGKRTSAIDALEGAREMPPGAGRIGALRKAAILRHAADSHGVTFAKRGDRESDRIKMSNAAFQWRGLKTRSFGGLADTLSTGNDRGIDMPRSCYLVFREIDAARNELSAACVLLNRRVH